MSKIYMSVPPQKEAPNELPQIGGAGERDRERAFSEGRKPFHDVKEAPHTYTQISRGRDYAETTGEEGASLYAGFA